MGARGSERSLSVAVLGIAALIVVSGLAAVSFKVGFIRVDAVVLGVPFALLLSLPYVRSRGLGDVKWGAIGWFGAVFVLFAMVSIASNSAGLGAIATLVRYLSYFLLTLVVGLVASEEPARRFLMWALVATGAGTVAVSVYQVATGQAAAGMAGLAEDVGTRVSGTFGNANFYGEFLVVVFAVALALAILQQGRGRVYAGAALMAFAGALFLTYTRGSWLALALALAISIPFVDKRLFLPLAAGAVVAIVAIPGILQRVLSIFSTEGTASFRFRLWRVAGAAIVSKPISGWGLGEFLIAYRSTVLARPDLFMGYLAYGAHNAYFTLAVETGLLGGVAFLSLVFYIATRGLFVAHRKDIPSSVRIESVVIGIGLLAFAVNGLTSNAFQHPQGAVFFWVTAGILVGAAGDWLSAPALSVDDRLEPAPSSPLYADSRVVQTWHTARSVVSRVWVSSLTFALFVDGHSGDMLSGSFVGRFFRVRS